MGRLSEELMSKLNTPVCFEIPIFGGIPVSESVVVTWAIMAIMVFASIFLVRNLKVVPGRKQLAVEIVIGTFLKMFNNILGGHGKQYVPYLVTILLYIGIANLTGIFGVAPPTKDLNVTAAMAVMSIILIEYAGIRKKGIQKWLKAFTEPIFIITPINVMEMLTRPLSLCMRLFGNILGGYVVMEMLNIVVPLFVPIPFSLYFDFFDGCVQAYVFVFLTSLFMKETMEEEDDEETALAV